MVENVDRANTSAVTELFDVIIKCFNDYTRNNKGDIGSILRIAAMKSIAVNITFRDSAELRMLFSLAFQLNYPSGTKLVHVKTEPLTRLVDSNRRFVAKLNS